MEQHFIKQCSYLERFTKELNLQNKSVLEFGVGTGVLTKYILDAGAKYVVGIEIDTDLKTDLKDNRLHMIYQDLRDVDYSFLSNVESNWCIVSFPPYQCLDFINHIIKKYNIQDVLLMIPENYIQSPPFFDTTDREFTIECQFDGDDFDPPSKGTHYTVIKGFEE